MVDKVVCLCQVRAPGIALHRWFNRQAEWRDPQHELLHLGVWQDVKRERGIGDTGSARLVFHSTHSGAACSDQLLLQSIAAVLDVPVSSLQDVASWTLGLEAATASVSAVDYAGWRAQHCGRLGDGLVVCGDYFGAMPSFTSCVVSAEAAVDELVRVSAHKLLYG